MKTILVVDDEADILDIYAYFLEQAGYGVILADSQKSALNIIKNFKFYGVIADLKMPNTNSAVWVKELEKFSGTSKVVLVTGVTEAPELKGSKLSVLVKPIDFQLVLKTLEDQ